MIATATIRLTGSNAKASFDNAEWYASPVPRKRLKELMNRSDRLALTNYSLWLALVIATGALLVTVWGNGLGLAGSSEFMASSTAPARIPAGTKPDTAPRSGRAG